MSNTNLLKNRPCAQPAVCPTSRVPNRPYAEPTVCRTSRVPNRPCAQPTVCPTSRVTKCLRREMQFRILIKRPPCYTIQSNPVLVLSLIKERKKIRQKQKNSLTFVKLIFRKGQPFRDDDNILLQRSRQQPLC